jgi:hypothetical protein
MLPPDAVVARNGTGEVTVTFLVAPSAADGARVLVRP